VRHLVVKYVTVSPGLVRLAASTGATIRRAHSETVSNPTAVLPTPSLMSCRLLGLENIMHSLRLQESGARNDLSPSGSEAAQGRARGRARGRQHGAHSMLFNESIRILRAVAML
jgi:hypothetical protein